MNDDLQLDPYDINAEEAVNGSMLIDSKAYLEIANALKAEDFYNEANRNVFKACRDLHERGTGIDQVTVAQELDRQRKLDDCGGPAYLAHLISMVPTSLDIVHYAEIVARLATMRDVIQAARQIQRIGHAGDPDVATSLAKVSEIVDGLKKNRGSHHVITPEERFAKAFDRYQRLYTLDEGIAMSTGLVDLDRALGGGLFPAALHILAGLPGMGKSALAQTIGNNVGRQGNVLYCSGEMTVDDFNDRDVAGLTGRPIDDIRSGAYDEGTFDDILNRALPHLGASNVYYLDKDRTFAFTTTNVYQAAYSLKEREGLALIVLDYLSLMRDKYGHNEQERVANLSGRVKDLAIDLRVPVLCLHQLSRAVEGRDDKVPKLHDLRDSGAVEQDADVVLFLHRKSYYEKTTADDVASVYVAKKRQGQGRKGSQVRLYWNEAGQSYENLKQGG